MPTSQAHQITHEVAKLSDNLSIQMVYAIVCALTLIVIVFVYEVEKMPLEGTQLGHYRLIKQIGGGGMSEVYLGQDLNIQGRQVAIKLVRAEVAPDPDSDSAKEP